MTETHKGTYHLVDTNDDNMQKHIRTVKEYLENDFKLRDSPERHFWHNQSEIGHYFYDLTGVIVFQESELVAFMTWHMEGQYYIEIKQVEVNEEHRKKGIFKWMLSWLLEKYPCVVVLAARVLEESKHIYEKMGWVRVSYWKNEDFYYKLLEPMSVPLDDIPEGISLALYSNTDVPNAEPLDFQSCCNELRVTPGDVIECPEKYKLNYFKLDFDEWDYLQSPPVIFPFQPDGYVGIFKDKKLVSEGTCRHVFTEKVVHSNTFLFLMADLDVTWELSEKLFGNDTEKIIETKKARSESE